MAYVHAVLHIGESNSGSPNNNSTASSEDLDPKPWIQILNNDTLAIEGMQIGVNNWIGHLGQTGEPTPDNTYHGWELGLANSVEDGDWVSETVYLLRCGMGGSRIGQWGDEGLYWTTFLARLAAFKAALALEDKIPLFYVWESLGINDRYSVDPPTEVSVIEAGITDWFARIRAAIDQQCPIICTKFMAAWPELSAMVHRLAELPGVYFVPGEGAGYTLNPDGNHWDHDGNLTQALAFCDVCTNKIGEFAAYQATVASWSNAMTFTDVVWTALTAATDEGSGIIEATSSGETGGRAVQEIDPRRPFVVEIAIESAAESPVILVVLDDDDEQDYAWDVSQLFLTGTFQNNGNTGTFVGGYSGGVNHGTIDAFPALLRLTKSGNDVITSVSIDGGDTFDDRHTAEDVLVGVTTAYVKAIFATPASGQSIQVRIWVGSSSPQMIGSGFGIFFGDG